MYRIIKVIGNNCVLVYGEENGRELILTGKGRGIWKTAGRTGQGVEPAGFKGICHDCQGDIRFTAGQQYGAGIY